ncbi:unnamed protein product, partial [Protopolystoma xenopodis]
MPRPHNLDIDCAGISALSHHSTSPSGRLQRIETQLAFARLALDHLVAWRRAHGSARLSSLSAEIGVKMSDFQDTFVPNDHSSSRWASGLSESRLSCYLLAPCLWTGWYALHTRSSRLFRWLSVYPIPQFSSIEHGTSPFRASSDQLHVYPKSCYPELPTNGNSRIPFVEPVDCNYIADLALADCPNEAFNYQLAPIHPQLALCVVRTLNGLCDLISRLQGVILIMEAHLLPESASTWLDKIGMDVYSFLSLPHTDIGDQIKLKSVHSEPVFPVISIASVPETVKSSSRHVSLSPDWKWLKLKARDTQSPPSGQNCAKHNSGTPAGLGFLTSTSPFACTPGCNLLNRRRQEFCPMPTAVGERVHTISPCPTVALPASATSSIPSSRQQLCLEVLQKAYSLLFGLHRSVMRLTASSPNHLDFCLAPTLTSASQTDRKLTW